MFFFEMRMPIYLNAKSSHTVKTMNMCCLVTNIYVTNVTVSVGVACGSYDYYNSLSLF